VTATAPAGAPPAMAGPHGGGLRVEAVSVRFGGVRALDDVAIDVRPGTVHGLIGPNGAGKTTLFNVVTGLVRPAAGRVLLSGEDVTRTAPHRRARLGMARTFQRLELFSSLTARENVLVAAERSHPVVQGRRGGTGARAAADEALGRVDLQAVADRRVDSLPVGTARLVELARALAGAPTVLLLDEPASGLDEAETEALGTLLGDLAGGGMAVLLVEHDMSLVMRVCDVVDVMDRGRVVATGTPAEIRASTAVREAYLGPEGDGRAGS
jgi:branched-chain amino acid transport system ATP-binding protein